MEMDEFNDVLETMPGQQMTFSQAVGFLIKFLIDDKKIPFSNLIIQHFSIPADRINKFLKMLKKDLEFRKKVGLLNQVDNLYLQETQYALQKINKREMFSSSGEVVRLVHMQQKIH